jgi:hypothetical protein
VTRCITHLAVAAAMLLAVSTSAQAGPITLERIDSHEELRTLGGKHLNIQDWQWGVALYAVSRFLDIQMPDEYPHFDSEWQNQFRASFRGPEPRYHPRVDVPRRPADGTPTHSVPEPTTLALLGVGAVSLVASRNRFNRSK